MERDRRTDSPLPLALVAVCFFGSGLTGLVYELIWTRRLYAVFGSTTYSVTTVLAAFMAGLGLGSYVVGRRVDAVRSGFRTYAWLELGVAAFALVSLPLLDLVETLYGGLQRAFELGPVASAVLKLVLAFPVLAFPAGMMGGTLPALARAIVQRRAELHRDVGRLYGINTIGAAAGTLLAGTLLIERLGLYRSILLAATVNALIGAAVLWALRRAGEEREPSAPPAPTAAAGPEVGLRAHLRRPTVLFCAVAVFLTGLLSMSYEVVWTRLLSLLMGSSTYAFTLVLGIFLVGIALGSLLYSYFARGRLPTVFNLALVLLALVMWAAVSLAVIPEFPGALVRLAQVPGLTFYRVLSFECLFAAVLLFVPTLLLGAALPMAMGIISRALGQVGRDVGGVYLVNTGGAILGSVLTGFVLIPWLGTRTTLLVGFWINLFLAAVGLFAFAGTPVRRTGALVLVLLVGGAALSQPPWPSQVYDAGLAYRLDRVAAKNPLELEQRLLRAPSKALFLREGVNATISVRQFRQSLSLLINGKPDASSSLDMPTQVVLGAVAMLAHPRPEQVAIVGWGSGVTAYTTTFFPELKRVDVMEIERAVIEAAPFFHPVNGKVDQHPKLRVIYDDARSRLLTSKQQYDVIVSEPSNPWMTGVSGLFSRDYYRLVKKRLKPGGVFGQWLQLYRIDAASVALVLRTLLDSFPHAQLWFSDLHDVLLLGSEQPFRLSLDRVRRAFEADARLGVHLAAYGPGAQPEHVFGCFLLDRPAIEALLARFPTEVMHDDRPTLEYRAVRNLYGAHPDHIDALLKLKMERGNFLPPLEGSPPPVGLALSGTARLVHLKNDLSDRFTSWALQRFGDEPQLRLERARTLLRHRKFGEAIALAQALPKEPGFLAEGALVEGRALLRSERAGEALAKLSAMGRFRPTARRYYQLEAATTVGNYPLGWQLAEELLGTIDDRTDPDALLLDRRMIYERIFELARRSKEFDRSVRLLTRRKETTGGEVERLAALLEAYRGAGMPKQAARTFDALLELDILDERHLKSCEAIYREAGEPDRATACRERRERLLGPSEPETLWK